ncbi:MAG: hypothetical protein E6F96_07180 [Actinobacteria bacterium]|nr:MAG: hypothetical protein E6F96_07180 [Actinomycetota bacterium]
MSTVPPPWNGPLLVSAQAIPTIGLVTSVDVDTSETGAPVVGTDGNHVNEATGGPIDAASPGVGGVTVKVTGLLLAAGFPDSEPAWMATAVYCPLGRAGLALPDIHPAPVPVAVAVETTVPLAVAPA